MNERLRKEYAKMQRSASHKPGVDEAYYAPADTLQFGTGRSVNNLDQNQESVVKYGSLGGAQSLRPEEAFELAIKRTLASGAPVNNIGFYDEVNWHLATFNQGAKGPLDIKEAITKLITKNSK